MASLTLTNDYQNDSISCWLPADTVRYRRLDLASLLQKDWPIQVLSIPSQVHPEHMLHICTISDGWRTCCLILFMRLPAGLGRGRCFAAAWQCRRHQSAAGTHAAEALLLCTTVIQVAT